MIRFVAAVFLLCLTTFAGLVLAQQPSPAPTDNIPRITVQELKAKLDKKEGVVVVDVRSFFATKIKGAVHIPMGELEKRVGELPKDKLIVTTCSCFNEATSGRATQLLIQKGYKSLALKGGQRAWEEAKYPIEQTPQPK